MLYSAPQTIAITLASLANNTRATSTTVVDNTVTNYDSASFQFLLKTGATGVSSTGKLVVALMGSEDNTTFNTNESQVLLSLTGLASNKVYSVNFDTNNMILPKYWKIAVTNISGTTLDATSGNFALVMVGHKNAAPSVATPATTSDTATASANTAAVVTYTADALHKHQIDGIVCSYTGTSIVGSLQIEDVAANVVFKVDITATGPIYLPVKLVQNAANTALIITLGAGGSGNVGRVNVLGHSKV